MTSVLYDRHEMIDDRMYVSMTRLGTISRV